MTALIDAAARELITTATDRNLFVVAGAGSGKTKSLVDRILTLVVVDGVPLERIAAVTFTEKAGAELRDRLRAKLEERERTATVASEVERARVARDELDIAAIGTLHAFAQRVLQLHPIEAQLPPEITVLDEVGSSIAMDAEWSQILVELLDDEEARPALQRALLAKDRLDTFQSITRALTNDWDLIDSHVLNQPMPSLRAPDPTELVKLAGVLDRLVPFCSSENDEIARNIHAAISWVAAMDETDDLSLYTYLLTAHGLWNVRKDDGGYKHDNRAKNWQGLDGGIDAAREGYDEFRREAIRLALEAPNASLRFLTAWLAKRVLRSAQTRRGRGELVFHDLLVLARQLLREDAGACASLRSRYTHLLLDEFQDTDPIQIELAVRIAGGAAGQACSRWQDIDVPGGSLFVVGDPKQSIYRFRRASIGLYLSVQDWFVERYGADSIVHLTSNFRSGPGVLAWTNAAFGELIQYEEGTQPAYQALDPVHDGTGGAPLVPVIHLGWDAHPAKGATANGIRHVEADDVAGVIDRAIREEWQVIEEDPDTRQRTSRPIRRSDIAVLVPARTSLPMLKSALDAASIPYRAEASSLVYQSAEVVDLLMVLQAIADPSDRFALVMALRSPLFGIGDDDLWRWKSARGAFSLRRFVVADDKESAQLVEEKLRELPVHAALSYLRQLAHDAPRTSPAEVLDRLIRDRCVFEVAAAEGDGADRWRRLRFVVDQAQAWSETAHGGIRAYLDWARRQGSETARVYESVLPESDLDAVRVLTVHAAKGLEYPMVVLSGLSSQPAPARGVQLLWSQRGNDYAIRVSTELQTNDFETAAPIDEQLGDAERKRLLYVGATRARDILVVSLHRQEGRRSAAAVLRPVAPSDEAIASRFVRDEDFPTTAATTTTVTPPEPWDSFDARATLAQDQSRRAASTSPSGLEAGDPEALATLLGAVADGSMPVVPLIAKGQRDLDTAAWKKGRDATAIGSAVHAVLQSIDLRTGDDLDAHVDIHCLAHDAIGHEGLVRELVHRALTSEVVRHAAVHEYWRESYIAMVTPQGEVVDGYADLIYRDAQGYHVVDYKTDLIQSEVDLASQTAYHGPQLTAYAAILRAATGSTPSTGPLFLSVEGMA